MSFYDFKETLKPCSTGSVSIDTQQSSFPSDFVPTNPRKPPKSSIFQQFLRLEDSSATQQQSLTQKPKDIETKVSNCKEEENDSKELEDRGVDKFGTLQIQFEHTGPFEPLILSLQGEVPVVQVPPSINCRLLEHQREGVRFLYSLYKNNHGGVLGDDMGLGKTIQKIAFLVAVFGKDGEYIDSKKLKEQVRKRSPVVVICPSSVIQNWVIEFSRWATFSVSVYHGANRELTLDKLEAHGVEVLITSFDTFRIHGNILSKVDWEIVIVDEAHRLKNEKSKLYTACLDLKTRKRIGLTGTIMQNKIMELFNLFDWAAPGSLGTREHFKDFYDEPLKHGQRSTAPERFVQVADERKQHLAGVLCKYMLRRTKEETIGHLMMGKEDNVVFCAMSELQKRAYRRMLQLPDIQCLIDKNLPCSCGSPLTQVECCKRTVPDGVIWPYLHRDNPEGCDSCPFCLVLPCLIKLQQKQSLQVYNHVGIGYPNYYAGHSNRRFE